MNYEIIVNKRFFSGGEICLFGRIVVIKKELAFVLDY